MLKKIPYLKSLKKALLEVPLIVLGKWELFDGLQIHPEKNLRRINKIDGRVDKARKAHKEGTQGA